MFQWLRKIFRRHPQDAKPKTYTLRLWKLGSLEHRIFPTEVAIQRLADAISTWDGKSPVDLIWDAAVDVEVHEITADELHAIALNPSIEIIKGDVEGILRLKGK